jgi:hypothetical protein
MVAHPDEPIMSLLSSRLATHLLSSSIPDPSPALRLRDIPKRPPTYWLEYFAREHPEYLAAVVASSIDEDGATVTSWTYRELEEVNMCYTLGHSDLPSIIGIESGSKLYFINGNREESGCLLHG